MTTPAAPDGRRRHRSRRAVSLTTSVLAVTAVLPAGVALAASPAPRVLRGDVPSVVLNGTAVRVAVATPSSLIDVAVSLRMRDRPGLDKLLASASDPSSPDYGHYLTQAEANAQFNPTATQEQRVTTWLRSNGLVVTHTYPNHLLVDAQGTVAQMSNLFKVTLNKYTAKAHGKNVTFLANANNPSIPVSVGGAVQTVLGLDSYPQFDTPSKGADINGTANGVPAYYPQDFADAYDLNPLWNNAYIGSGQSIGITLWEVPPSDDTLNEFQQITGAGVATRANGRLTVTDVGGGASTADDGEASMDIEYSSGMAPGASINYYAAAGPTNDALADALNAAGTAVDTAGQPLNRQISNSWGGFEDSAGKAALDGILAANSVTGHNYFFSSGDNGSWASGPSCGGSDPYPDYPTSSAYVTSVGGTTFDNDVAGAWPGESAWAYDSSGSTDPCTLLDAPEGSGGGYSVLSARPSWQVAGGLAANGARGYPDVAADADPTTGAFVDTDTEYLRSGGTSLAAPLWAGMTSVLNQYLSANGRPTAGFVDPMLYAIANRSQVAPAYHDVTLGTNGAYDAVPGWDAVTGWGSPDFYHLAQDWTVAPFANTTAASNVGQTTATLNGAVDPNNTSTSYHFDYGTTAGYGASSPTGTAGAGGSGIAVSAAVSGLLPGTTYHYRISTANGTGTANGLDQTFVTTPAPPPPPLAPSPPPTPVAVSGATLLERALAASCPHLTGRRLLKKAVCKTPLTAPSGGRIRLTWVIKLRTRSGRHHAARQVIVATGARNVAAPQKIVLNVKLTAAGRRYLRRTHRRVWITKIATSMSSSHHIITRSIRVRLRW